MIFGNATRLALCAFLLLMPLAASATAQDTDAKSLLTEIGQRQSAFDAVTSLERLAARIVHIESVAILSLHGDWPEEQLNWVVDVPKFLYDVNNIYGRFQPELTSLRRSAARAGAFSEEEQARFDSLLGDLSILIDESRDYYALLAAGKTADANAFYRDRIRQPYLRIVDGSYTLGTGISGDLSRLALKARLLK